jgi:hypothetical protein
MRFFKISEGDEPVAVVFHDAESGECVCRSRKQSFLKVFEIISSSELLRFSKDGGAIGKYERLEAVQVTDASYAESVLSLCLGGFWQVVDDGSCANSEASIDSVVGRFFPA